MARWYSRVLYTALRWMKCGRMYGMWDSLIIKSMNKTHFENTLWAFNNHQNNLYTNGNWFQGSLRVHLWTVKTIYHFNGYWSMSDYDEGTKESWGWSTRLRESLSPLLGFKGEKNGHSSSEAESSVNVKICFITNIIKENFPKSTSWKILTQCNWRFTQRKSMLSAGQKVAFLSQT